MFDIDTYRVVDHEWSLKVAEEAAGLGSFAGIDESRLCSPIVGLEENNEVSIARTWVDVCHDIRCGGIVYDERGMFEGIDAN